MLCSFSQNEKKLQYKESYTMNLIMLYNERKFDEVISILRSRITELAPQGVSVKREANIPADITNALASCMTESKSPEDVPKLVANLEALIQRVENDACCGLDEEIADPKMIISCSDGTVVCNTCTTKGLSTIATHGLPNYGVAQYCKQHAPTSDFVEIRPPSEPVCVELDRKLLERETVFFSSLSAVSSHDGKPLSMLKDAYMGSSIFWKAVSACLEYFRNRAEVNIPVGETPVTIPPELLTIFDGLTVTPSGKPAGRNLVALHMLASYIGFKKLVSVIKAKIQNHVFRHTQEEIIDFFNWGVQLTPEQIERGKEIHDRLYPEHVKIIDDMKKRREGLNRNA